MTCRSHLVSPKLISRLPLAVFPYLPQHRSVTTRHDADIVSIHTVYDWILTQFSALLFYLQLWCRPSRSRIPQLITWPRRSFSNFQFFRNASKMWRWDGQKLGPMIYFETGISNFMKTLTKCQQTPKPITQCRVQVVNFQCVTNVSKMWKLHGQKLGPMIYFETGISNFMKTLTKCQQTPTPIPRSHP